MHCADKMQLRPAYTQSVKIAVLLILVRHTYGTMGQALAHYLQGLDRTLLTQTLAFAAASRPNLRSGTITVQYTHPSLMHWGPAAGV